MRGPSAYKLSQFITESELDNKLVCTDKKHFPQCVLCFFKVHPFFSFNYHTNAPSPQVYILINFATNISSKALRKSYPLCKFITKSNTAFPSRRDLTHTCTLVKPENWGHVNLPTRWFIHPLPFFIHKWKVFFLLNHQILGLRYW